MIGLFTQIQQNAISKIVNSSDRELQRDEFANSVLESLKFKCPSLRLESTSTSIQEEFITFNNAPSGITFSPGQKMEVAYFTVPIEGKTDLFTKIIKNNHFSNDKLYFDSNKLTYREPSINMITNNDELIDNIKQNAKNSINAVQDLLKSFENSYDDFFANKLKPEIEESVNKERERRNSKSKTEIKLNPFL